MRIKFFRALTTLAASAMVAQPAPSPAEQIAGAVQAAPKDRRDGAEVLSITG